VTSASPQVVVVVCGDPGGASAMAPVLERLQEGRIRARALAYKEARSIWRSRGLEFEELAEDFGEADAAQLLAQTRAAALAVGTSGNSVDLEKRFVAAARRTGTPSLGLLDFWSNYLDRFGDDNGALVYVPDVIAVMDESARAEMIEQGFDPSRLIVTGQPAFDALPRIRAGFTAAACERVRHGLGAGADARLVAFVSQPMAAIFGTSAMSPGYMGYTEQEVLAALLGALRKVAQVGVPVVLAVLPHPREDPRNFAGRSSADVEVVVSRHHSAHEMVMSADLVVGMNSILLMEACYLGCPTLSLQPGLRQTDTLPTNRIGISRGVQDAAEIDSAVAELLLDESSRHDLMQRLAEFRVDGGAAERVAGLIYDLTGAGSVR
jgi:hypothetical protein